MRLQAKYLWVLLFAMLIWAPALKANGIVVSNDEWMFGDCCLGTNNGFGTNNDPQFAQNIAGFLTGGSGSILIDSSDFGLAGGDLQSELTTLGYNVTEEPSVPTSFGGYSAVFLGGTAVDNTALTNYVNSGGSVFLEAGTGYFGGATGEADAWNPFLNAFGFNLATSYNNVVGNIDVSAFQTQGGYSSALFGGVNSVYIDNGNNVALTGSAPADQVWSDANGYGLYGAWSSTPTPAPEPATISLMLIGIGLGLVMRKYIAQGLPQAS
jgi:hypothetical protein